MNFASQNSIPSPLMPRLVNIASETPGMGASPFARAAGEFSHLGFHVLPLEAGSKAIRLAGWTRYATTRPTEAEIAKWSRWHDANIGAAMGSPVGDDTILIAIDIDVTGIDDIERVKSALPRSPMSKLGSKGETLFFRAPAHIESRNYERAGGGMIVEVLSKGRQTVLPPSIHPDTRRPYVWTAGPIAIDGLPILDEADLKRLREVAEALGAGAATTEAAPVGKAFSDASVAAEGEEDSGDPAAFVNRRLNQAALDSLDRWAGELRLPKLRRTSDGWEAVPAWRPSGEGRPLEVRKPSLKLHRDGIRDMGANRGLTAIDTVVDALGIMPAEAFGWLAARINAFPEHDVMTSAEVLFASAERRRLAAIEATVARQGDVLTWDNRHANAARSVDWLVKHLFPRVGVSLLWGQSGSGKSFVVLDLAASIGTGSDFFGHRVKAVGGTLFALGEGEGAMPGRLNAIRLGKLGDMPSDPTTGQVVNADELPIAWMPVGNLSNAKEFEVFAAHVRRASAEMLDKHGCPLRLVVIDTVVASFGFPEDPDASSVTRAMKSLDGLAQELGLLVVAIHHAGKSKAAAEHGSYAWRGSAETSIEVDAERNEATGRVANRRLVVRKNRHGGNEGWANSFELSTIVLGTDEDGDDVTSCVVLPSRAGESASASRQGSSQVAERFLTAFHTVRDAGGGSSITLATGCAVLAVRSRDAKAQFEAQATTGTTDSKRRQADRGRKAAIEASLLAEESAGDMWLYLPAEGVLANDNLPGQRPGQRPF